MSMLLPSSVLIVMVPVSSARADKTDSSNASANGNSLLSFINGWLVGLYVVLSVRCLGISIIGGFLNLGLRAHNRFLLYSAGKVIIIRRFYPSWLLNIVNLILKIIKFNAGVWTLRIRDGRASRL